MQNFSMNHWIFSCVIDFQSSISSKPNAISGFHWGLRSCKRAGELLIRALKVWCANFESPKSSRAILCFAGMDLSQGRADVNERMARPTLVKSFAVRTAFVSINVAEIKLCEGSVCWIINFDWTTLRELF